VSKADLIQISQHFGSQQILQLSAWLNLASKVCCASLFKSDHRSKLKKLERANKEINRALDIKQLLRTQQMTRILAQCLLSPQSFGLAQRATAKCILHGSTSSEETPEYEIGKLEGW
jgi:hypothetical protein